ncbi:MAG: SDR family NAD(P)-dependent oxidoreductase [Candidatus Bathyarchaeia archaeon]
MTGKVALITGGGRGIGRAIAIGFAEHGADVAVCSRTRSQLEEVAGEINRVGRRALPIVADLSVMAELNRVVVEALSLSGISMC